jgi:hypothetical protein
MWSWVCCVTGMCLTQEVPDRSVVVVCRPLGEITSFRWPTYELVLWVLHSKQVCCCSSPDWSHYRAGSVSVYCNLQLTVNTHFGHKHLKPYRQKHYTHVWQIFWHPCLAKLLTPVVGKIIYIYKISNQHLREMWFSRQPPWISISETKII